MKISGAMAEDKVYFVASQHTEKNEFTGRKGESYFVVEVTKDEAKTMQGIYKELKALDKHLADLGGTRTELSLQEYGIEKGRRMEQLTPQEQKKVQDLEKRIGQLFTSIQELDHKRDEVESRWKKVALLDHPEGATKPIPGGLQWAGKIWASAELRRLDPDIKLVKPSVILKPEGPEKRQPQKQ
jgi:predicted RNase H-like nuclease (RuvC/YqgF family)